MHSDRSARNSSISLGEKVRVIDIARLQNEASVVCFAACVSGLIEDNISNDMLGFSHAVIASGASTFLDGLWEVDDAATMVLMILSHRTLKIRKQGVTLAASWRRTQIQLYEMGKPELKTLLEELLVTWDEAKRNGRSSPLMSAQPKSIIINMLRDSDEVGFTHPFN